MIEEYVNSILPDEFLKRDSYKDLEGRGFIERYLSIFGVEADEVFWEKIKDIPNIINPFQTSSEYVNLLAYSMGNIDVIYNSEDDLRNLLTYILSVYKIKGTKQSYKVLLRNLGFEADIEEIPLVDSRYDIGLLYDDDVLYDDNCQTCSNYKLLITGTGEIGIELYRKIENVVNLVEPINAILIEVIYNDVPLGDIMISVTIDEEGNLVYDNTADPSLILTLDELGDIHISGPNASRYYIGEDGNLYYIILP